MAPNGSARAVIVLTLRFVDELCGCEIPNQQKNAAHVNRKHFPPGGGQPKENCGRQHEIGENQNQIGLQVGNGVVWSQPALVKPREAHTNVSADAYAGEDQNLHHESAEKPSSQIVELGDRRGVEEVADVAIRILVGRLSGDGAGYDDAEEGDVHGDHVQRVRGIQPDLTAGAEVHRGAGNRSSRHAGEQNA